MLGAHALALLCVAIAVGLGLWQFDAWHTRRAAEAIDLTQATPVPLDDLMGPDDPFPGREVGQPVEVRGTWLPEGTVYVSGREHEGREGYWVVTPLTSGGPTDPALPVVRGWVDDPADAPAPPSGEADLVGWLQPSEGTGAVDDDPRDDVFPQLRIADLVQRIDTDLYSAYAVLDPARGPSGAEPVNTGTDGLEVADLAQLPEAGGFTALRNLLYAVEWWFFGAFAVFIWWRFLGDERVAREAAAAGPDPDEGPAESPDESPDEDSPRAPTDDAAPVSTLES
ncbi:SURF1 family protein [soil metagenome]